MKLEWKVQKNILGEFGMSILWLACVLCGIIAVISLVSMLIIGKKITHQTKGVNVVTFARTQNLEVVERLTRLVILQTAFAVIAALSLFGLAFILFVFLVRGP